jgi:hypothetical protein
MCKDGEKWFVCTIMTMRPNVTPTRSRTTQTRGLSTPLATRNTRQSGIIPRWNSPQPYFNLNGSEISPLESSNATDHAASSIFYPKTEDGEHGDIQLARRLHQRSTRLHLSEGSAFWAKKSVALSGDVQDTYRLAHTYYMHGQYARALRILMPKNNDKPNDECLILIALCAVWFLHWD